MLSNTELFCLGVHISAMERARPHAIEQSMVYLRRNADLGGDEYGIRCGFAGV